MSACISDHSINPKPHCSITPDIPSDTASVLMARFIKVLQCLMASCPATLCLPPCMSSTPPSHIMSPRVYRCHLAQDRSPRPDLP
ncbi:hypothetical protein E2C01_013093 [Portunus trituberculatus]|uniref:Uncharacterized protein n=1 Tax=Portunus trituberculatus TaxID=210409 RepID=A0A5B7DFD3_PORTR|nr:hypothetical protein [Portunus trituberculatus]